MLHTNYHLLYAFSQTFNAKEEAKALLDKFAATLKEVDERAKALQMAYGFGNQFRYVEASPDMIDYYSNPRKLKNADLEWSKISAIDNDLFVFANNLDKEWSTWDHEFEAFNKKTRQMILNQEWLRKTPDWNGKDWRQQALDIVPLQTFLQQIVEGRLLSPTEFVKANITQVETDIKRVKDELEQKASQELTRELENLQKTMSLWQAELKVAAEQEKDLSPLLRSIRATNYSKQVLQRIRARETDSLLVQSNDAGDTKQHLDVATMTAAPLIFNKDKASNIAPTSVNTAPTSDSTAQKSDKKIDQEALQKVITKLILLEDGLKNLKGKITCAIEAPELQTLIHSYEPLHAIVECARQTPPKHSQFNKEGEIRALKNILNRIKNCFDELSTHFKADSSLFGYSDVQTKLKKLPESIRICIENWVKNLSKGPAASS